MHWFYGIDPLHPETSADSDTELDWNGREVLTRWCEYRDECPVQVIYLVDYST